MEEIQLESRDEDDLALDIQKYEREGWRKKGKLHVKAGLFVDLFIQVMVRDEGSNSERN